jgi:probable phosphoglycerate mutase
VENKIICELKKTTLYIVRHGKTLYNIEDIVQGFSDSPLTEEGVKQSFLIGKSFQDIFFTSAFCGDLGRQRDTAENILSQNKNAIPQIKEIYGFREWSFGGFEKKPNASMWEPIYKKYGIDLNNREENYKNLVSKLGYNKIADEIHNNDASKKAETFAEISKRIFEALNEVITLSKNGGNVLIVSSGMLITSLLYMFGGIKYKGELISNCSVSILEYENGNFDLKIAGSKEFLKTE